MSNRFVPVPDQGDIRRFFGPTSPDKPESYCFECGEPYPWRQAQLRVADEIAREVALSEASLDAEDQELLAQSLKDIAIAAPKQELAGTRIRRLLVNAPAAVRELALRYVTGVTAQVVTSLIKGGG